MKNRSSLNVLLVLSSVAFALASGELFLRWFAPQAVARLADAGPGMLAHPPHMYVTDPDTGYALSPGFDGLFVRPEYQTPVHVNRLGLRGPEPRPHGPDTFRILALGDSFTWGYGVAEDDGWPRLLEALLRERYRERDVQVLNGGVPGFGTDEELAFLASRGELLRPDLVITMFFAGNDFEDNRAHARDTHEIRHGMLYDKVGADRRLLAPWWVRLNDWAKARSHFVSFVSERAGYLAMRAGLFSALTRSSSEHFSAADAARATALLADIVRTSTALGARSLLVYAPEKTQVLSGATRPPRATAVVRQAATLAKAPWLDLTPALRAAAQREETYYLMDGHWRAEGNAIVAKRLLERIMELGL